jgi:hypothetical protein
MASSEVPGFEAQDEKRLHEDNTTKKYPYEQTQNDLRPFVQVIEEPNKNYLSGQIQFE